MATSTSADPLRLLIKALAGGKEIILLAADQTTQAFSLPECEYIALPTGVKDAATGTSRVVLPKNTSTRYKTGAGFYDLQCLLNAFLQKDKEFGDYFREAAGSGIGYVSALERKSALELLSGKRPEGDEVVPLETPVEAQPAQDGPAASATPSANQENAARPTKRAKYQVNKEDQEAVKKLMQAQEPKQITDRETVLRGAKPANFDSVRVLLAERIKTAKEDLRRFEKGGPAASAAPVAGKPASAKKRTPNPIIIVSPSPSALISMFNVKRFLEEGIYQSTAEARAAAGVSKPEDVVSVNHRRQIGLPSNNAASGGSLGSSAYGDGGMATGEKNARYFVVDSVEALSKFGDDAWDRVVCVMTTGQDWQFRQYRYPEPKELFHHVKGISFGWTNEMPNDKIKGWNVTELKLDPIKRHIDKSVVADFWARLETWITMHKPFVAY